MSRWVSVALFVEQGQKHKRENLILMGNGIFANTLSLPSSIRPLPLSHLVAFAAAELVITTRLLYYCPSSFDRPHCFTATIEGVCKL